jgi:hypothetical protein
MRATTSTHLILLDSIIIIIIINFFKELSFYNFYVNYTSLNALYYLLSSNIHVHGVTVLRNLISAAEF